MSEPDLAERGVLSIEFASKSLWGSGPTADFGPSSIARGENVGFCFAVCPRPPTPRQPAGMTDPIFRFETHRSADRPHMNCHAVTLEYLGHIFALSGFTRDRGVRLLAKGEQPHLSPADWWWVHLRCTRTLVTVVLRDNLGSTLDLHGANDAYPLDPSTPMRFTFHGCRLVSSVAVMPESAFIYHRNFALWTCVRWHQVDGATQQGESSVTLRDRHPVCWSDPEAQPDLPCRIVPMAVPSGTATALSLRRLAGAVVVSISAPPPASRCTLQ